MTNEPPLKLTDRLQICAELWADATSTTLARLGRAAVNDSSFFGRIDSGKASTTTATLEKFARFFADAGNWPEGLVPDDVRVFVHVVGITPAHATLTTGNINDLSGGIEDDYTRPH